MKRLVAFIYFSLLGLMAFTVKGQDHCGFDEMHKSRMENDEEYRKYINDLESKIKTNTKLHKTNYRSQPPVYDVPVVVHVIHLGEAIGTGTNISDAQIKGAIQTLNNEFRNVNGTGVDMQINFCLAARDPNGNPSSGINRVNGTVIPNFSTGGINNFYYNTCANEKAVKDLSRWPFESYLNIWVVSKICGGSISGYATGQTGSVYNGISILSSQMSASKVTLAHEVGHMFNLYHTFNGDGTNVTQGGIHYCPTDTSCADNGDRICDTPPHKQGDFGSFNPCTSNGIWDNSRYNIMSYSFVYSGNFNTGNMRFTQGQKDRVRAVLLAIAYHPYVFSNGCTPATPNDASVQSISYPLQTTYTSECTAPYQIIPKVNIKNFGSNVLTSLKIHYKLDNNSIDNYEWIGTLAPNASTQVTLPGIDISEGAHNLLVYNSNPNQMQDGNVINDSVMFNFNYQSVPSLELSSIVTNPSCFSGQDGMATVLAKSKIEIKEDWESPSDWTIANGSEVNHWVIGSATSNGGTKSIYISKDNINNTYNTYTTSIVHFYKDFYFPPGATNIKIKFDWKGEGQFSNVPGGVDYMRVYLIPVDQVVQPLFRILSPPHLGSYHSQLVYRTDSIIGIDSIAGSFKRLVFSWRNDYDYGGPSPASVDNIVVSYELPNTFSYTWNTIPVQTNATATGLTPNEYQVSVTDASGCSSTLSINVQQPAPVIATITANGPLSFCHGGAVTLSANEATSYLWSNGEVTRDILVASTGNYTVTITDGNGCTSASTITSVHVVDQIVSTVSSNGPLTFCQGGSVTLKSNNAASYLWNNGATTREIEVGTAGDYQVTITDENGCTGISNITSVNVHEQPLATITPNSETTFCEGGTLILSANIGTTYLWSNDSITQNIAVTTSGVYKLTITNENGCTGISNTIEVNVKKIPSFPEPIMGEHNGVCANSIKQYSIPLDDNASYYWVPPSGATIIQGQATNQISLQFSPIFKNGTLGVVKYNECGVSPIRKLLINSTPAIPTSISGSAYSNCNTTSVYKTNKVVGANTYTWSTNIVGAVITSFPSPNDTMVNIAFPTFASGSISVVANNNCGSSPMRTINVIGTPPAAYKIYGAVNPCAGTLQNYYIAKIPGVTSYEWTVPSGSVITNGAGTNTIQVLIGNSAGDITVSGVNACGVGSPKKISLSDPCNNLTNRTQSASELNIFPNPTNSTFQLAFNGIEASTANFQIFDLSGNAIQSTLVDYNKGLNVFTFDLSQYNNGMYFVKFTLSNQAQTIKVIKQ
jgi:hypothetical protein